MVCSRSSSAELKLVRAQLFGPSAEPIAQKPLDQQPQLVVLGLTLLNGDLQRDLLLRCGGDHISQHLLEDGRVVGRAARSICTPASL